MMAPAQNGIAKYDGELTRERTRCGISATKAQGKKLRR